MSKAEGTWVAVVSHARDRRMFNFDLLYIEIGLATQRNAHRDVENAAEYSKALAEAHRDSILESNGGSPLYFDFGYYDKFCIVFQADNEHNPVWYGHRIESCDLYPVPLRKLANMATKISWGTSPKELIKIARAKPVRRFRTRGYETTVLLPCELEIPDSCFVKPEPATVTVLD